MSIDNPLWGAPRIHGELLKLGFEVAQSMVANHGQAMGAAEPGMAQVSAEPCPRHRCHGFVRGTDYRFQPAVCTEFTLAIFKRLAVILKSETYHFHRLDLTRQRAQSPPPKVQIFPGLAEPTREKGLGF
jgi:hypothetical protein